MQIWIDTNIQTHNFINADSIPFLCHQPFAGSSPHQNFAVASFLLPLDTKETSFVYQDKKGFSLP